MDENKNESAEDVIEEETPEADLTPDTDWEAEAKKARGIAQRALTKLKKLGTPKVEPTEPVKQEQNASGLDETALDYLDLKGISESEDIEVIQKVVARTGQTVRQVLKDEYVLAKLSSNKQAREVKSATPTSTKRGGNQTGDLATALSRFERDGTLPDDFELKSQVVNALAGKSNPTIAPWHR